MRVDERDKGEGLRALNMLKGIVALGETWILDQVRDDMRDLRVREYHNQRLYPASC